MKKIIKNFFILSVLFLPAVSFASGGGGSGVTIEVILEQVRQTIQDIIPIVIGIGVLIFLWGVLKYIFSSDSKSKVEGARFMTWGVIALLVMTALWGFVVILQSTLFKGGDASSIGESETAVSQLQDDPTIEGGSSTSGSGSGINKTVLAVADIIQVAIPPLISLGILLFIWGVYKYVSTDNAKAKSEATAFIVWGLLMLLVMSITWGFVKKIAVEAGVSIEQQPSVPPKTFNVQELILN